MRRGWEAEGPWETDWVRRRRRKGGGREEKEEACVRRELRFAGVPGPSTRPRSAELEGS